MLELTRALTAWLHADTELRQAQAQTPALNDYGRGYQDGLTDADNFYLDCDTEDCDTEDCDTEDCDTEDCDTEDCDTEGCDTEGCDCEDTDS